MYSSTKMRHMKRQEKSTHLQEIRKSTEPDTDMASMLKSSGRGLKVIMFNMYALLEKMQSMEDRMDNFRREQSIQELWGNSKG